jgi:hypothetical protein
MRKYGTIAGTLLVRQLNYRPNMKFKYHSKAFMMLAYPLNE